MIAEAEDPSLVVDSYLSLIGAIELVILLKSSSDWISSGEVLCL